MRKVSIGIGLAALIVSLIIGGTCGLLNADGGSQQFIRKELEWTKPLNLQEYGGSHIELYIRDRDIGKITILTVDFTENVGIARTKINSVEYDRSMNTATVYGSNWVDNQAAKNIRQVEKKNGVPFPGSSRDMYLLYQDYSSGVAVYYLDEISRMNYDNIVIAVPKSETPPSQPTKSIVNVAPESTPLSSNQNDGMPISAELFSWYVKLQKEREALDTSNPKAVAEFNSHVAAYLKALTDARQVRRK